MLNNEFMNVGKTATVASFAGVTRKIQTRVKIHDNIYLVDTPGILSPTTNSPIQSIRLALAGRLPANAITRSSSFLD
jgi:ribosome biogenesis GTPase A